MNKPKVQAREIVRYAKRNGFDLCRGGVGNGERFCARAIVMHMFNGDKRFDGWRLYDTGKHQAKTGLSPKQLDSLEMGFEGVIEYEKDTYDKRYFDMGQRVARMVGLEPYKKE